MRIVVNGDMHGIPASTLAEALDILGYGDAVVATAVNGRFVPSAARREFRLSDDDAIEVVAPMQGG